MPSERTYTAADCSQTQTNPARDELAALRSPLSLALAHSVAVQTVCWLAVPAAALFDVVWPAHCVRLQSLRHRQGRCCSSVHMDMTSTSRLVSAWTGWAGALLRARRCTARSLTFLLFHCRLVSPSPRVSEAVAVAAVAEGSAAGVELEVEAGVRESAAVAVAGSSLALMPQRATLVVGEASRATAVSTAHTGATSRPASTQATSKQHNTRTDQQRPQHSQRAHSTVWPPRLAHGRNGSP